MRPISISSPAHLLFSPSPALLLSSSLSVSLPCGFQCAGPIFSAETSLCAMASAPLLLLSHAVSLPLSLPLARASMLRRLAVPRAHRRLNEVVAHLFDPESAAPPAVRSLLSPRESSALLPPLPATTNAATCLSPIPLLCRLCRHRLL